MFGTDLPQPLEIALGGMMTPVLPAMGSTMTAAMLLASCRKQSSQFIGQVRSSAGNPLVNAFFPMLRVWGR